jgi:hypothetical protein
MKITKSSLLTGKPFTMDLDITQDQLDEYNKGKKLIQDIFPDLNADEREFIMTGYAPGDWEVMFPPEDELEKNK